MHTKILECGENGFKLVKTFISGQGSSTDKRNRDFLKSGQSGGDCSLQYEKSSGKQFSLPYLNIHLQNNPTLFHIKMDPY